VLADSRGTHLGRARHARDDGSVEAESKSALPFAGPNRDPGTNLSDAVV